MLVHKGSTWHTRMEDGYDEHNERLKTRSFNMSTMWSLIGKTARGDVLDVTPRIDAVSFLDNSRTNISDSVTRFTLSRDYRSGLAGSMTVTNNLRDPVFWYSNAINPSLVVTTSTGVSQVKLGLLVASSVSEGYKDMSVSLADILSLHKQVQVTPFSTAPETGQLAEPTATAADALSKIRELTSSSRLVGSIDHRGFEPTTLLNPNPDIDAEDDVAVRSYVAGSSVFCELERLLTAIDWRPPWSTRRGLITSEKFCSSCDQTARENARKLPTEVVYSNTFKLTTNMTAPNMLRVLDTTGESASRKLPASNPYSLERSGRSVPHLIRARSPVSNIEQFWASVQAPRRTVSFKCAAPGVFWHRDTFKLNYGGLLNEVCVVSRWNLDVISGVYTIGADVCGAGG